MVWEKKPSVLREKSFIFSVRIVKLGRCLQEDKREFVLSKQLLRSGTAIGALIREAEQGESRPDFIHKLAIGLKEANETEYWIDLLFETELINEKSFISIKADCVELIKLLTSIIKTTKKKQLDK